MNTTATSTLVRDDQEAPPVGARPGHGDRAEPEPVAEEELGRRSPFSEGRLVFALSFAAYLVVAVLLDFKYHAFSEDAFSRMANGFYILYSRDPHLASVGFVWEPLQSMADLVFLLGNHLWPALSHNNMAGSLVSSLSMAGAAYQVCAALREWDVSRIPRLILTAFFVLNPMILFYAGNGMSEGLYIFTLVASMRYLLRWIQSGDLRSLAYAAVALAFSYLTRNEAAGAAVLGTLVVGAVSYSRVQGPRRHRFRTSMSDLTIFAAPPFIAIAGWAITSYVITGHFIEQVSSIYGNSEQELFLHHKTLGGRILFEVHALEALWPLLPIVLVASIAVAFGRRDPRILGPLAILGGALGFDMLAYLNNNIENFFRYFIVAVPLEVMLVGSILAGMRKSARPAAVGEPDPIRSQRTVLRILTVIAAVVVVLITMVPASITTTAAMFNPKIGSEEVEEIGFIFHKHQSATDLKYKDYYPQVLALGNYFAHLDLPNGDVVVDNSTACVPTILTTISQPKLFVIPNDRDFQKILADPITFHVHYILEPNPTNVPITAANLQWPTLWQSGAGFAKEVRQFAAHGPCPEFRLFHVLHHSNEVA